MSMNALPSIAELNALTLEQEPAPQPQSEAPPAAPEAIKAMEAAPDVTTEAPEAETTSPHNAASGNPVPSTNQQLATFIAHYLPAISLMVEDGVTEATERFGQLAEATSNQGNYLKKVVDAAQNLELDGDFIGFNDAIRILYEPLSEAIEKILEISKLAMSMVMTISTAVENIEKIEHFIQKIQAITKQTNMLAFNTAIEAERAGVHGRSFQVLAHEVRSLSNDIQELSRNMQTETVVVTESIKKCADLIQQLANYDMVHNLTLKDRIEDLIRKISDQNNKFTELMGESADLSHQTSQQIGGLVMTLQFQDRASQMMDDLRAVAAYLSETLPGEGEPNIALAKLRLADLRNHLQAQLDGVQSITAAPHAAAAPALSLVPGEAPKAAKADNHGAAPVTEEDNIELF